MNTGNSTSTNLFLRARRSLSLPGATVVAFASGMFLTGAVSTAYGQWPPEVTDPEALNTNAASATGWDDQAQLTTDGAGEMPTQREGAMDAGHSATSSFSVTGMKTCDAIAAVFGPFPAALGQRCR